MPKSKPTDAIDLSPEATLARAAAARGDIFPEWKVLAHASARTYDLVTRTGGYFHHYHGETGSDQQLSGPMRELIATPALCAKPDWRHSPNHVRRMYRLGLTNRAIMEGATAFGTVTGWATIANTAYAIIEANNPDYPFGKLPAGGEPKELVAFPELDMGRKRRRPRRGLDTPEWRYAARIDPELARRASVWRDHCLLAEGATDELLGPGPRELIVVAALCTRGEIELAAEHILEAYDCGMSKRQVLEAISTVIPMAGIITAEIGLRAMQQADRTSKRRPPARGRTARRGTAGRKR